MNFDGNVGSRTGPSGRPKGFFFQRRKVAGNADFANQPCDNLRLFRLTANIVNQAVGKGRQARISVTVGVATIVPGADSLPGELFRDADASLYQAKAAGRDGYRVAD